MQITLGNMKKKKNSTKNVFNSGDTTYTFDVQLKENTSIRAPIFLINFKKQYKNDNFNYCKFNGFCYYIDDIVYVSGDLYEIHCSMDLLASYKNVIKNAKGRVLYCTNSSAYNDKEDDPRFSPTDLNVYATSNQLASLRNSGAFFTNDNVFSGHYDLWDIHANTYVLQAKSTVGLRTYILNQNDFEQLMEDMASTFWSGVGNFGKDLQNYIVGCDLIPINYNNLISHLTHSEIGGKIPMYLGNDTVGTTEYYAIPNLTVLGFLGDISIPRQSGLPFFMYSNKWNKAQLITPGGVTDLNLDMGWRTGSIHFSTKWDIPTGDINVRFQLHTESSETGSFNDSYGNTYYECNFNINSDAMGLVQKRKTIGSLAEQAVGTGLSLSAAALGGGYAMGAMGMGAGISKIAGVGQMRKLEKASGFSHLNSNTSLKQGINETINEFGGLGGASNIISTGMIVNKMNKTIDTSTPNGVIASNLARLSNTVELGLIHISNTLLRCKELSGMGSTIMQSYRDYCNVFGYPVNEFFVGNDGIYECMEKGSGLVKKQYIVVDDVLIEPKEDYNGYITDEIIDALEKALKSGIWYE